MPSSTPSTKPFAVPMSQAPALSGPVIARPARRRAWALAMTLIAGLPGLGACQAQPGSADVAAYAATAAESASPSDEADLLARIRGAIGEAACSSDAQCRTLPVGEKACGGPQGWLAWSVASPQAGALPGWADELAALARQRNRRSGLASNCQYLPDPGAVCQRQRCVLRTPALAR